MRDVLVTAFISHEGRAFPVTQHDSSLNVIDLPAMVIVPMIECSDFGFL